MSRYREADLGKVRTLSVGDRKSKVTVVDFARPVESGHGSILDVLPNLLAATSLRKVVEATAAAVRGKRPVLFLLGGHVIKTGLNPLLVQLMERGAVSALAVNGAAAIHDFEVGRFGKTSENVEASLGSGSFGMAEETSAEMNNVTVDAAKRELGLGEALGDYLWNQPAPHRELSLLAQAHRLEIPVTVHVALGTDILHQHVGADGGAIGNTSLRDFRILAGFMEGFRGGVALNWGSAVVLPEVFLKAFSVAANLGAELRDITTANFDFNRHYRPRVNLVERPTSEGRGEGYEITGHHEIMFPLFAAGLVRALEAH